MQRRSFLRALAALFGASNFRIPAGAAERADLIVTGATIHPVDDQTSSARWLSDLEVSYRWAKYTFAIGAENLFGQFPDRNLRAGIPSGSAQVGSAGVFLYPINSPFGRNGRVGYSRVSYNF